MDKLIIVHPYNGTLQHYSNEKEQTMNTCNNMRNLENMLGAKKPDTKEYILLCDSTYMQMEKRPFQYIVSETHQ